MAFTNFAYTNQSSGVCSGMRNSGTNGDLCALLHTALTSGSNWVRTYNTANKMCWQPAAGGPVLMCNHNSAVSGHAGLATIRLAESESGGVLTDPCPTVAQVANNACNWLISNTASTTTCDFHIVAWETGLIYASRFSGYPDTWDIGWCVKTIPRFGGDTTYNWAIGTRSSTFAYIPTLTGCSTSPVPSTSNLRTLFLRDIAGALKSEWATVSARGTSMGNVGNVPAIRGGYGSSVDRMRVCLHGNSSTVGASLGSQTVIDRGCIPQLWMPVHSSLTGVSDSDVISDGSSQFVLLKNGSDNGVLLRITNDEITTFPSS